MEAIFIPSPFHSGTLPMAIVIPSFMRDLPHLYCAFLCTHEHIMPTC